MLSFHPLPKEALAGSAPRRILPSPEQAIRIADRYEVLGFLESGGTADVHLASDLVTGKRVALKRLRGWAAESSVARAHFLAGSRAAMRIEHPNIVRMLEVIELEEASPCAAMELLEGQSLSELVRRERALPQALAVELVTQAARGLSAAHQVGVVHCDVKPENLFVSSDEAGSPRLKILDFDLASIDGLQDPGEQKLLRGTPKYMAPEQIVGDPVDGRTDVYALGMVLFRLLTGQLPFDLPLGTTLLRHHLYSPVPPVSWLAENIDPKLETLIARATRKHPQNRYPNMLYFCRELEAFECGAALSTRPLVIAPDHYR
ncbi:MAG TPA: serine/threonine-protein kinase, partial [Polyangiaceae bacterium]|nr:serine/threonine-protein kinase [Polyangiaceae bacterium]